MMSLVGHITNVIAKAKQTLAQRKAMKTLADLSTALTTAQNSVTKARNALNTLSPLVQAPASPIDYSAQVDAVTILAEGVDSLTTDIGSLVAKLSAPAA